jgi:hypothetical protein
VQAIIRDSHLEALKRSRGMATGPLNVARPPQGHPVIFQAGTWDEAAGCRDVQLRRGDGTDRRMRPRHIVFANGVSTTPIMPDPPGLKEFRGAVRHSGDCGSGLDRGRSWGEGAMMWISAVSLGFATAGEFSRR